MSPRTPVYAAPHVEEWIQTNRLDLLRHHCDRVDWYTVSVSPHLSASIIDAFVDKLDWFALCQCGVPIPEELLWKHSDHLTPMCWLILGVRQRFSEEILRHFHAHIGWYIISTSQRLSPAFMQEFAGSIRWVAFVAAQEPPPSPQWIIAHEARCGLSALPAERLVYLMGPQVFQLTTLQPMNWQALKDFGARQERRFTQAVVFLEDWLVLWATAGCLMTGTGTGMGMHQ